MPRVMGVSHEYEVIIQDAAPRLLSSGVISRTILPARASSALPVEAVRPADRPAALLSALSLPRHQSLMMNARRDEVATFHAGSPLRAVMIISNGVSLMLSAW